MLVKPFRFSRALRVQLETILGFKLKINDKIRTYATFPKGQQVLLEQLVTFIRLNRKVKRVKIPSNMYYNMHVRDYWTNNPKGNFKQCVRLWHQKKSTKSTQ